MAEPADREMSAQISDLRSDNRLLFSKIDGLTMSVDTLTRARQFSWPAVLSAGVAVVVFGNVAWQAILGRISAEVNAVAYEVGSLSKALDETRADSRENRDRLSVLETSHGGFVRATEAKEIEVETQFKYSGIIANMRLAEEMRSRCRIDPKECSPIIYFPEQGRLVSNGSQE